jgi:hypothetical protein
VIRFLVALFALYGLLQHTGQMLTWRPVADTSTIAFVALLLWSFMPDLMTGTSIGGLPVPSFKQALVEAQGRIDVATASMADYTEIIADLSNLITSWTESNVILDVLLTQSRDDAEAKMHLFNFLRDRMGEAREWVGDTPGSDVRLALWVYNPTTRRLGFFFSNEIVDDRTKQATFEPGEGMMGQAFLERRTWDERDVSKIPAFRKTRGKAEEFATLCEPIGPAVVPQPLGMLTIDKPEKTYFSRTAHDLARALAAISYMAITLYGQRRGQPAAPAP